MKELPILFSTSMVQAILAGQKTQTRRIVKSKSNLAPPPEAINFHQVGKWFHFENTAETATEHDPNGKPYLKTWTFICPYGMPVDRLWVRETFCIGRIDETDRENPESRKPFIDQCPDDHNYVIYKQWCVENLIPIDEVVWKPSIFMPKSACRIKLEITEVRVERLNNVSEADAIAEGCTGGHGAIPGYGYAATPVEHYRWLWESIHGKGSWQLNPWVWVVTFKLFEGGAV